MLEGALLDGVYGYLDTEDTEESNGLDIAKYIEDRKDYSQCTIYAIQSP